MPKVFKPRRSKRDTVKTGNKKTLVLQDGELMVVRKTADSSSARGVKCDIYIGNGITQMQNMKPALYGDTSEEPLNMILDPTEDLTTALSHIDSGYTAANLIGSIKKAILLTGSEADIPVFSPPTAQNPGTSGKVPAPAKNTMNYVLTATGWKANAASADKAASATLASSATKDSRNQQIDQTYIKGISVSGSTLTVTKGNNSESTFILKDEVGEYPLAVRSDKIWRTNSTSIVDNNNVVLHFGDYDNNTTTVSVPAYSTFTQTVTGLVPAPTTAHKKWVLTGEGWAEKAPKATSADSATNATSANKASTAVVDTSGTTISDYIKNANISTAYGGQSATFAFTKGDNGSIIKYIPVYKNANGSNAGAPGLVPPPSTSQKTGYVLTSDGWTKDQGSVAYAISAEKATKDNGGTPFASSYGYRIAHKWATYYDTSYASTYRRYELYLLNKNSDTLVTLNPGPFNFTSAASSECHGGMVPLPSTAMTGYVLTTGGWTNVINCEELGSYR